MSPFPRQASQRLFLLTGQHSRRRLACCTPVASSRFLTTALHKASQESAAAVFSTSTKRRSSFTHVATLTTTSSSQTHFSIPPMQNRHLQSAGEAATSSASSTLARQEQWLRQQLESEETADNLTRYDFIPILRQLADEASSTSGCAVRAERWLGQLERLAVTAADKNKKNLKIIPDATCYRLVIQAWADSNREDADLTVVRAHRWLMKHMDSPLEYQRPDTKSFNAFLDAVSRGRSHKGAHSLDAVRAHAVKAQETLQLMIDDQKRFGSASMIAPDTDSFNYVMRAWTRCRRAPDVADRTMEALRSLEEYQNTVDPTVRPNVKSYGMVLDSLSCRVAQKARTRNTHVNNYKHGDPSKDSSENGLDELEMMEKIVQLMHNRGGETKPTTFIYNILIAGWANLARRHKHGPPSAERVLQLMTRYADQGHEELKPDAYSYLLVMRAWANSRIPNRAERVAWWLQTQWKDFEFDGDVKRRPTAECYNIVIRLYSEIEKPSKAEEYFQTMTEDKGGILPNTESLVFVIKGWIAVAENRGSISALQKAAKWLDYAIKYEAQEDLGIQSPREAYGSILAAARKCAPTHPVESLAIAVEVFGKMRNSHHPVECVEYTRLLQVGLLALSRREHDDMRTKFIHGLVKDCAENGHISGHLVRAIANGAVYYDGWTLEESKRLTTELFGDWPFPSWWTRNIKQDGFFPKRGDLRRINFYEMSSHEEDPYRRRSVESFSQSQRYPER